MLLSSAIRITERRADAPTGAGKRTSSVRVPAGIRRLPDRTLPRYGSMPPCRRTLLAPRKAAPCRSLAICPSVLTCAFYRTAHRPRPPAMCQHVTFAQEVWSSRAQRPAARRMVAHRICTQATMQLACASNPSYTPRTPMNKTRHRQRVFCAALAPNVARASNEYGHCLGTLPQ